MFVCVVPAIVIKMTLIMFSSAALHTVKFVLDFVPFLRDLIK